MSTYRQVTLWHVGEFYWQVKMEAFFCSIKVLEISDDVLELAKAYYNYYKQGKLEMRSISYMNSR